MFSATVLDAAERKQFGRADPDLFTIPNQAAQMYLPSLLKTN